MTWYPEELRQVEQAREGLGAVTAANGIGSLFRALRLCMPFAAGMVESLDAARPAEMVSCVFHLPEEFISARARHISIDPAIPLVPRLPCGLVSRSIDLLPEPAMRALPFIEIMYPHFGVDHVVGLPLWATALGLKREHVVLWLFQESSGKAPSWRQCQLLELLHTQVQAAMARMRLPLLPAEPIRFQLLNERAIGVMLLRPGTGELIELNQRAALLAYSYSRAALERPWRPMFEEFIQYVLRGVAASSHCVRYLEREGQGTALEVSTHYLDREHYALEESALLVELREVPLVLTPSPRPWAHPRLQALPPRQREVARLLADTGLSYKQIALQLGLSEGTIRKHVERVYRALGVHSRLEFMSLLKQP